MSAPSVRQRLLGNTVMRTAVSLWVWFALGVIVIIWVPLVFIVWMLTAPFDRGRYWPGLLFRKLCVVHQWLNPLWRFRVTGVKITDPRRPYVVVSNHESFVDILLISHLPWEMKWLSKEDFFRYPLVGWLMRMAGDIKVVRGQRESVIAAMKECNDRLDKRVSVMLFPEGTRTRSGELQPFKDGAFRLAIDRGCPILPLAVTGAREGLPTGDWRFGVTDAEVRVLAPIETTGMTIDDVAELRDRTRALIGEALVSMRG